MANTYTTRAKFAKPGTNDAGWGTTANANFDAFDAIEPVGGLLVTAKETPSTTLNVAVAAGNYRKSDGTIVSYAGTASFACTASATNSLYLTDAGTLTKATTGYPSGNIVRLATVVAGSATITSVTDNRVSFQSFGTAATSGAPSTATYITQTADAGLSAEQALSSLSTGLMKVTTGTGVISTATAGTDYLTPSGNGSALTALNATQITSGAIPNLNRLGTGTADGTKFLRDDLTWVTPSGGGSTITVQDEGTPLTTGATTLNFVGSGVTASGTTATKTITISAAPIGAKYIVQQADSDLTAEQALGALATGILKNTTTTGVLSIAAAGTDYLAPAAIGSTVQAWDADLDVFAGLGKTKGNVIGTNGTTWGVLAIGSDGQVMTADAASTNGFKWSAAAGGGDASTNTSTSTDSQLAAFSGTGGKTIKRVTGTGAIVVTSGVYSTTDFIPVGQLGNILTGSPGINHVLQGDGYWHSPPSVTGLIFDDAASARTLQTGSTNGVKIGGLGHMLAFFGATPVVQPTGANQAALTNSTGGTASFTIADVGASFSQSTLNNNFSGIIRLLNQIRSDLVTLGAIKGSA